MRICLAVMLASIFVLFSCNCGSPALTASVPPPEVRTIENVPERDHRRELMEYIVQRTVSVYRDCTPKEGMVFFDVSNPERILDGRGTGVIIRSYGDRSYIFTAAHVVVPESKFRGAFTCEVGINRNENLGNKDTRMKVEIVAFDDDRDLAVLKVAKDLGVNTEIERNPFAGEPVWAVGYPVQKLNRAVKTLSITGGSLAAIYVPAGKSGNYHRVTADIYFGNSGGGIWTVEGKLVGIAALLYGKDAVPYYYIKPATEYEPWLKGEWKYWEVFQF